MRTVTILLGLSKVLPTVQRTAIYQNYVQDYKDCFSLAFITSPFQLFIVLIQRESGNNICMAVDAADNTAVLASTVSGIVIIVVAILILLGIIIVLRFKRKKQLKNEVSVS